MTTETVEAAQIVLPCKDLDATLAFFTERLGFRLETIHPADDPSVAVISGYGVRLELARGGVSVVAVPADLVHVVDGSEADETRVQDALAEALRVLPGTTLVVGDLVH